MTGQKRDHFRRSTGRSGRVSEMTHHWVEVFPELELLKSEELRKKIMEVYDYASRKGGWKDLKELPFSLLVKTSLNYVDHVRAVTKMSIDIGKTMKGSGFDIDMDVLLAGGLLHDVGKLVEYARKEGKIVKSNSGKHVRHPISGAIIAHRFGLGDKIINIIASHSREGNYGWRCNEAIIVHHADFTYFETVKANL